MNDRIYESSSVDAAAGGHVIVTTPSDGMVLLMTSNPKGRPGSTLLTTDEVRALITTLEGMVTA